MRFLLPTIVNRSSALSESAIRDFVGSDPSFGGIEENSAIATLFDGDDEEELGIPEGLADGFTARYEYSGGSGFVLIYWDEGSPSVDEDDWCESPITILFEAENEKDFVGALGLTETVTTTLGLRVNAAHFDSWLDSLDDDAFDDGDIDYVAVPFTDPLVLAEWRAAHEGELDARSLDADAGAFPSERAPGLTQETHQLSRRVSSVDVSPVGMWAGIDAKSGDLFVDGKRVASLPSDADWHVRLIDDERVFVFHYRYGENALVVSRGGEVTARWSIPPGLSDVIVTDDFIVVGYCDEGVYHHGGELGENGLAAFTFDGEVAFRYQREIRGSVDIADLYAMAPLGGNRVAFSAYTGFEYVELDIGTREHVARPTPSAVHYSRALASDGVSAWFLTRQNIVRRLDIDTGRVAECGRFPDGTLVRGLVGGRFLSAGANGYTIVIPG
jgi:hypothetical protein